MGLQLPEGLLEKTHDMPESSYGANRVTLILNNGRQIPNVFLAWGKEIIKIGDKMIKTDNDLDFKPEDIKDIIS